MAGDSTNRLFALNLPEGWTDTTVYTFEGPDDSGVRHNLVVSVTPLEKDIGVVQFAKSQLELSTQALPGLEITGQSESSLPSGVPAYIVVYRFTSAENTTVYQKQYYVKVGERGYTFTASFSKKTLKTIAAEVDRIVGGFREIDPETLP